MKIKYFCLLSFLCLLSFNSCDKKEHKYSGYIDADYVYISAYNEGKIENIYVKKGQTVKVDEKLFETDNNKVRSILSSLNNIDQALSLYIQDIQQGAREEKVNTFQHLALACRAMYEGTGIGLRMNKKLATDHVVALKDLWVVEHVHDAAGEIETAIQEWIKFLQLSSQRPLVIKSIVELKQALKSQISYYQWLLAQTVQVSPYDAIIFDIFYRKGEFVQKGKPVVALLPPKNIKAKFYVDGKSVNKISLNETVNVFVSGVDRSYKAKITYISSEADYTEPYIYSLENNKKLVYMIEAKFENSDNIHPGQPIDVSL